MIRIVGTALYQWDTGRYVTTDIDADHVHFSNKGDSKAVIMDLADSQAKIPDYLLQTGKQLCVYVVRNGITVESKVFSVNYRERPENYIYEEDQRNFVYELIASAEAATKEANQAAAVAAQAGQSAGESANRATEAANAAEKASDNANQAAIKAAHTAKSLMVVGEARGSVIHLDDAIDQYLVGCRIFGKTTQNGVPTPDAPVSLVSIGDTGSIGVSVVGKNLWNHANDTADMSSLSNWGYHIWGNAAVVATLKPNTTYTMKCKVTCLSVPDYTSVFSDMCGFYLHSDHSSGISNPMAIDGGKGAFTAGEQRILQGSFTTPDNIGDTAVGYRILYYTQRFFKEDGTIVFATVRCDDVQLEVGDTSSDYVPHTEQKLSISTPNGLPGIPVTSGGNYTDSNGQQWICDEIDFARGAYIQRVLRAEVQASDFISVSDGKANARAFPQAPDYYKVGFCSHAELKYTAIPEVGYCGVSPNGVLVFGTDKTSLDDFRAWLGTVKIQVLVPTQEAPIENPLTEEELAAYANLHTYKEHATVFNDGLAYMKLEYVMDAKKYIDGLFAGGIIPATVE